MSAGFSNASSVMVTVGDSLRTMSYMPVGYAGAVLTASADGVILLKADILNVPANAIESSFCDGFFIIIFPFIIINI